MKQKAHASHELAYARMKREGLKSWGEAHGVSAEERVPIDPDTERFLMDALAQPWAPRAGRAIELGCGTGPMTRWLAARGFDAVGIDVSPTAIALAQEQSKGASTVHFQVADACAGTLSALDASFDLVLDGHCLHCIPGEADRQRFLETARRLLRPGGIFLLDTMCTPLQHHRRLEHRPQSRMVGRVLYMPTEKAVDYELSIQRNGQWYLATRYLAPPVELERAVRRAGFQTVLTRLSRATGEALASMLSIAAVAV